MLGRRKPRKRSTHFEAREIGERERPAPRFLRLCNGEADDETRDQNHHAGSRRQPEPQGPRQRAQRSPRYHQGSSRRREAQYPRAGRPRQSGAEYEQQEVGVRAAYVPYTPSFRGERNESFDLQLHIRESITTVG